MKQKHRKGEVLFRHGDSSRYAFRVLSGEAEVLHETPDGPRPLGSVKPGDLVGEIGALVGAPRSATVRFTTDAETQRFDRRSLIRALAKDRALGRRMLDALSLRTRFLVDRSAQAESTNRALMIRSHRFRAAPAVLLRRALLGSMNFLRRRLKRFPTKVGTTGPLALPVRVYEPGALLFAEGEASREVLIIRSGVVECVKATEKGEYLLGRVRAGEILGEMGVLEHRRRNATARAKTRVTVEALAPDAFFALMEDSPSHYYRVVDALCERANNLTMALGASREAASPAGDAANLDHLISSFGSLTELAGHRMVEDMNRAKRFLSSQASNGKEMMGSYRKLIRGEATPEEIERANAHFRDYLKIAGLGTLFILPGGALTVPLMVKLGKVVGVDILPSGTEEPDDEPDEKS